MTERIELTAVIGDQVSFAKTVSESDVYQFAGISGDFADNHINEEYMRGTRYGRRIAHGALLVAYMSCCSTKMAARIGAQIATHTPVSLGYDRIRFLAPVFIGDTVTVSYRVAEVDAARLRVRADIEVHNQDNDLVAVAQHILKWVAGDA